MKNKVIMFLIISFFLLSNCLYSQIHVYDSNDQYLGVLLGTEWMGAFTILIPSLNKAVVIAIDADSKEYNANIDTIGTLFYLDEECKGTSYHKAIEIDKIFVHPQLGLYSTMASNSEIITPTHRFTLDWNTKEYVCESINENSRESKRMIPIHKANFELPFNQPISLPLHFKYSDKQEFDINGNSKLGLEEVIYSLKVVSGYD
jgi:hypothetical protein